MSAAWRWAQRVVETQDVDGYVLIAEAFLPNAKGPVWTKLRHATDTLELITLQPLLHRLRCGEDGHNCWAFERLQGATSHVWWTLVEEINEHADNWTYVERIFRAVERRGYLSQLEHIALSCESSHFFQLFANIAADFSPDRSWICRVGNAAAAR